MSKKIWREAEMSGFVQPNSLDLTPDREAIKMNEEACAPQRFAELRPITRWLTTPWVDKTLANLAVLPFVYPIATHFRRHPKIGEIIYTSPRLCCLGAPWFFVGCRPELRLIRITGRWLSWPLAEVLLPICDPNRTLPFAITTLLSWVYWPVRGGFDQTACEETIQASWSASWLPF